MLFLVIIFLYPKIRLFLRQSSKKYLANNEKELKNIDFYTDF